MGVAIKLKARHEIQYGDLHYKFLRKQNFPKMTAEKKNNFVKENQVNLTMYKWWNFIIDCLHRILYETYRYGSINNDWL